MSYNYKRPPKPINILEMKIKKNPKYDYISSVLDTGCSISKYKNDMEYVKRNFRLKANEIFKRMKLTTFVQMLLQIESVNLALTKNEAENDNSEILTPRPNGSNHLNSAKSTLFTLISGFGELDDKTEKNKKIVNKNSVDHNLQNYISPYLLLDLRDAEAYAKEHIKTAISYPMTMLSRMINYEIKEMLAYKAKEEKIIIVYDWDEKNIHRAASTLVERGYKNLVVLSGGLKVAKEHFGASLLTNNPSDNTFNEANVDLLQKTLDYIINDRNKYARLSMSSTASVRTRRSTRDVNSTTSTIRSQSCLTKPQRAPFRT